MKNMQLQLALDMLDTHTALSVTQAVAADIDIIEIGTPLIKHEGLGVLKALRKEFPHHQILVDLKTMDVGEYEADFCFGEGANIVTVLGAADDDTIKGSIKSAKHNNGQVLVDLINVPNKPERAKLMSLYGADYIGIHSGIDQQLRGMSPLGDLIAVKKATNANISVAGGINMESIDQIIAAKPSVVIVGGAITGASDPGILASDMKRRIQKAN